jgi:hypothetical protein
VFEDISMINIAEVSAVELLMQLDVDVEVEALCKPELR